MLITFAQLFKAYSAFNNDGLAMTPRLVNYLEDAQGKHYILEPKVPDTQAVSKKTANQIHDILLEVVKRGTGVAAQYPGLEIGGKTGTAHIAKNGHYVREFHSSFYGFANDKFGHKYTIGVLVIRAKKRYKYFASQSAVPTFKNIVKILVEQEKLILDPAVIEKMEEDDMYELETVTSKTTEHPVKTQKIKKTVKKKPRKIKKKLKKKVKKVKKPKIEKVLKEPALPTTQPAPEQIQKFDNIEDLF